MRLNRRQLLEQVGLAGAALATGGFAASAEGEPSGWRAGTAIEEITPPLDVGILMSSGRRLWAPFVGVRMPLYARALVIDNGHARVGLLALDLLGLAGEAVGGWEAFKRRLVAHAAERLSHDSIVLACSHTHSGPESLALTDLYKTKAFHEWVDVLCDHCSAAIGRASRARAGAAGRRHCTSAGLERESAALRRSAALSTQGGCGRTIKSSGRKGQPTSKSGCWPCSMPRENRRRSSSTRRPMRYAKCASSRCRPTIQARCRSSWRQVIPARGRCFCRARRATSVPPRFRPARRAPDGRAGDSRMLPSRRY